MQPYLFPYLGYFQLAYAVDEFWLLDTVQYIQRGWMNRNTIRSNDKKHLFTIPVKADSRDEKISNKRFSSDATHALQKLVRSLVNGYARAPFKHQAIELVLETGAFLETEKDFTSVVHFSLEKCFSKLGIRTQIRRISELNLESDMDAQSRIIAATARTGATRYLNMIGGAELYNAQDFQAAGLDLGFVAPVLTPYEQAGAPFIPGLSILDLIAHLPKAELEDQLALATVHSKSPI
jgi:hypothetical protein